MRAKRIFQKRGYVRIVEKGNKNFCKGSRLRRGSFVYIYSVKKKREVIYDEKRRQYKNFKREYDADH